MSTTLNIPLSATIDSGWKSYSLGSSTWNYYSGPTSGTVQFGASTAAIKAGGVIRFRDVNVPPGANIDTAYITVYSRWTPLQNTVNAKVRGEDADDSDPFDDTEHYLTDFDGRARTTAEVSWSSVPAWNFLEADTTPEIKTIIQEIVDRTGWEYGNSLSIFIDDFDDESSHVDTAARVFFTYFPDYEAYAPVLHIEFSGNYPTVTTQAVSDVGVTTATGNGNITSDGDLDITERGVCYGTSPNPTTADTAVHDHTNTDGAFTMSLTGLTIGQRYYLRAYATNSIGTAYGDQVVFIPGWTEPKTWAWKDIATHTQLNSYIRDNEKYLKARADVIGACTMVNQTSNRAFSQSDSTLLDYIVTANIYRNESLKPRIIMACVSAVAPGSGGSVKTIDVVTGEATPPTAIKTKQTSGWIIWSVTMYVTIMGIVPPGWYYLISYYDSLNTILPTPDTLSYWYEFDIG